MKHWMHLFLATVATTGVISCASNPHKAKNIETKIEKDSEVTGDTRLGIKDGNLVVQRKVKMNEELRLLQNEVYSLEDRVYGNRKYGSQGLYGSLKKCRMDLVHKKNGGDGKLMWTEPVDRVTDKEEEWEVGIDESEKIVGVSEEFLKDRIARFRDYKKTLQKREDEYQEKLEICDAELAARKFDKKKAKAKKAETEEAAPAGE